MKFTFVEFLSLRRKYLTELFTLAGTWSELTNEQRTDGLDLLATRNDLVLLARRDQLEQRKD